MDELGVRPVVVVTRVRPSCEAEMDGPLDRGQQTPETALQRSANGGRRALTERGVQSGPCGESQGAGRESAVAARGSQTEKVVPWPTSEATSMLPL
jgi:hypothetical protein